LFVYKYISFKNLEKDTKKVLTKRTFSEVLKVYCSISILKLRNRKKVLE
jgi:hypothetical protein